MQDSLLVTCPKCKSKFRDNARRIQSDTLDSVHLVKS